MAGIPPVYRGGSLMVAGLLLLSHSAPERPLERPRLPAPSAGPSCPLPVGAQVKAVREFRKMLPVFRHPRCLNCHGGVDPLSAAHRGADQLDPAVDRMQHREAFEAQCQECHDGLPGWNTPGEPVFFTGKDDEELCRQMKRFERTGASFIEHLDNDHHGIQFIAAGFAGDRALGEGLKDYGLVAEKPPGTQPELVAVARRWVEMLGSGYEASPDCGCVIPGIKLRVRHTELAEARAGGGIWKEGSEAEFEVKLESDGEDQATYAGEHTLSRRIWMTLPKGCTSNGQRQEQWTFSATVDSTTGEVSVRRDHYAEEPTGGIVCRNSRGTGRGGMFPGAATATLGYGELRFPPDSGATRSLTTGFTGYKETLTMTLLEIPGR